MTDAHRQKFRALSWEAPITLLSLYPHYYHLYHSTDPLLEVSYCIVFHLVACRIEKCVMTGPVATLACLLLLASPAISGNVTQIYSSMLIQNLSCFLHLMGACGVLRNLANLPLAPSVDSVLSPPKGATLIYGETYEIRWSAPEVQAVSIQLWEETPGGLNKVTFIVPSRHAHQMSGPCGHSAVPV